MESPEESYNRDQREEESGKKKEMALGEGGRDESGEGGKEDPKNSSSSLMLGLLDEFTKIYSDRLQRVEETAMKCDEKQYWENKVCVLESWVRDLGEQNAVLVVTVEELEREAADRVALLEDRLNKMAATTRESCVSLRDHQIQVSSLVTDKIGLEKKAQGLGEKVLTLERKNVCLKEENVNLQSDLNNLVQVITRARQTGQWEADDLTFSCVTPEQVFGPVLSSSRRSSQSLKDGQRDYLHQLLEDHLRKDNSSMASSFSNLQDAESSMYGGRGSEKDLIIMKLRSDFRNLQSSYEETSQQLLERDKQIADLQTQLTETHHELALSQAEVNTVKHTLQEVRHRNRHESVEITRKEEVIRHLLSKQSFLKKDSMKGSSPSMGDIDTVITGENNVEAQLSENIDVLASRLADLEDECQQLRNQHTALQETHALCSPTINMLQEQLNRSHQTQVELRTVLTAEVAQRHDELVTLRDELKEQEQMHHETQMQLQLKAEVIKDLRKELRDMKDRQLTVDGKNTLTSMKDGVYNGSKETKSTEVQTSEIFSNKNISLAEETNRMSSNGFYSPASQPSQISKLENELAEKCILLRELQSHLASSRQELHLKDETLQKLEQKLDSSRREGSQKGERMQYLTGQLTSLQLEVGRTHGQAEQLRRQVEKKTELIEKMETENSSLTQQLNEKSSTLERFQTEILKISTDLEKRRKEVAEQRMTIRTLQEALVSSKRQCDELHSRLDNDLVESGARGEVLQEENRALSRRVGALQEDLSHAHKHDTRQTHYWKTLAEEATQKLTQAKKENETVSREKEQLLRQAQEAERRRQEVLNSLHLLQGQVQTLEEEVTAAAEARAEAERRAEDIQRNNLQLQEHLSVHETSESVERLGQQLEEAVAALTAAREEARNKGELLRRAQQDVDQLSDALGYEKDLNTTLHDQVEVLMKEATMQENKGGELQQEMRRLTRDALQKDRQVATLQSQLEGLRCQVTTMEELLDEEQREVASLTDSLTQENKILQEVRIKCDRARKEAARSEEQIAALKRELQETQDKISRQDRRAREMESEREAEVAAVAERLTAMHEESVRRLEDTLLSYTRMQAHEEYQVESLEESVKELGARLADSELRVKETQKERDALGRSLQEERSRREQDAHEHQRQILRLTEETSLLKVRGRKEINEESD
ncbi:centrosome-associated protein CEP250-like isoform X2 [Homarus americanus]|uniref:centrosome-associated protein CEP250-like isoform X2 n=1 Tax=Homarus americanus TaxID=6706 RepID=UPI001C47214B|nr:centrosome-associated protein CEP250-like isoform X2 [Homarus americanus]